MDEILASIRRIIADDGETGSASSASGLLPTGPAPGEPDRSGPALALADGDLAASANPLPEASVPSIEHEPLEPASNGRDEAASAVPVAEPVAFTADDPAPATARTSDELVSSQATEAIGIAFNALSHTILAQNARTLEDLVKDLLRPMLKVWLDDNLPPLVERLVRAEIERVARGHR